MPSECGALYGGIAGGDGMTERREHLISCIAQAFIDLINHRNNIVVGRKNRPIKHGKVYRPGGSYYDFAMAQKDLVNATMLLTGLHDLASENDVGYQALFLLRFDEYIFDDAPAEAKVELEELILEDLLHNLTECVYMSRFFVIAVAAADIAEDFLSLYSDCKSCRKLGFAVKKFKNTLPRWMERIAQRMIWQCRSGQFEEIIASGEDGGAPHLFDVMGDSPGQLAKLKTLRDILLKEFQYDALLRGLTTDPATDYAERKGGVPYPTEGVRDFKSRPTRQINLSDVNVLSCPWGGAKNSFYGIIQSVRKRGFVYSEYNHKATYIPELNLLVVENGFHSIAAAHYVRTGSMPAKEYCMAELYERYTVPNMSKPVMRNTQTGEYITLPDTRWVILFALAQRIEAIERKA